MASSSKNTEQLLIQIQKSIGEIELKLNNKKTLEQDRTQKREYAKTGKFFNDKNHVKSVLRM
jgi:hypothetical protein